MNLKKEKLLKENVFCPVHNPQREKNNRVTMFKGLNMAYMTGEIGNWCQHANNY